MPAKYEDVCAELDRLRDEVAERVEADGGWRDEVDPLLSRRLAAALGSARSRGASVPAGPPDDDRVALTAEQLVQTIEAARRDLGCADRGQRAFSPGAVED